MTYKLVEGGICAPQGFIAGAINCDIKGNGGKKLDLTAIFSEKESICAGVFTTNKFAAAPVVYCREIVASGKGRAIVVNSGCANAVTGEEGLKNTRILAEKAASLLNIPANEVLVSSTGVIGVQLPIEKMSKGLETLIPKLNKDGGHDAELAIMTTDTVPKEMSFEIELSGGKVVLGAMSKGSGMIHPNMATMLAYVTTDANISSEVFTKMMKRAVDKSFNMTTVDGDTSTNDTMIALANGASGVSVVSEEDQKAFYEALEYICVGMAKMVARDGEGATHLLVVEALELPTEHDARLVARAIAGSSLFKAAVFGQDANWGRILSAAGYSGAEFKTGEVECKIVSDGGEVEVMKHGAGLVFNEELAAKVLKEENITVIINFHDGNENATAFGCDLTYDYVKINGDYRS